MSLDAPLTVLRLEEWDRSVDVHDQALLRRCVGPTLDVGCGPGRLTAALAERGQVVLGIDVVARAVRQTRRRGAVALRRDVFEAVPGEGRWRSVLLADGNIGIGGNPVALLRRLRAIVRPRGRVVAELAPPGTPHCDDWATLHSGHEREVIRWSIIGVDAIEPVADRSGLAIVERFRAGDRWAVVLEEAA